MFRNKKILAIIPARGGSKGIPKKNIVPVGGRPLIAWTIEAAKKSKYINKIVVSSDSDEILNVAKKWGAYPLKRPAELATDTAPPEPIVFHVLDHLKKKGNYIPNILVYLQPTSPLRTRDDIDSAFNSFFKSKATAVISVYELDKKYLKAFITDKNGFLKGAVNNKYPFMNRQQLPSVYMPNGAIYIITRKEFMKTGQLFSNKTAPHVMTAEKSFDLDTLEDLKKLRRILKKRAQNHE
ncbi:MAG: acylneuraminate cytidylyltransferase family protein [Patescibacteria group bacterium]